MAGRAQASHDAVWPSACSSSRAIAELLSQAQRQEHVETGAAPATPRQVADPGKARVDRDPEPRIVSGHRHGLGGTGHPRHRGPRTSRRRSPAGRARDRGPNPAIAPWRRPRGSRRRAPCHPALDRCSAADDHAAMPVVRGVGRGQPDGLLGQFCRHFGGATPHGRGRPVLEGARRSTRQAPTAVRDRCLACPSGIGDDARESFVDLPASVQRRPAIGRRREEWMGELDGVAYHFHHAGGHGALEAGREAAPSVPQRP